MLLNYVLYGGNTGVPRKTQEFETYRDRHQEFETYRNRHQELETYRDRHRQSAKHHGVSLGQLPEQGCFI